MKEGLDTNNLRTGFLEEVVTKWIQKWRKDFLLPEEIQKYLMERIPDISKTFEKQELFIDTKWPNCNFEEPIVEILEKFMFHDDNRNQIFNSASICGKILRSNNFYYRCKECEIDGDRPLCVECFENSTHGEHKYRICKSQGNASCRCGESESWKDTSCCTGSHQNNKSIRFSADLEGRVRIVITGILSFVEKLLKCEEIDENGLENDDKFCLILDGNVDDLESIPKLCELVLDVMGYPDDLEDELAKLLHNVQGVVQENKIIVKLPKILLILIKSEIEQEDFVYSAKILHVDEMVYQELAYRLLRYLQKCMKYGKEFRRIFTGVTDTLNIVEQIFSSSSYFPKKVQIVCHELFVDGTMMEYENKKTLAKMMIGGYATVINRIYGNPLQNARIFSAIKKHILSISSLSHYLIVEENAICVLLKSLLVECFKNYATLKSFDIDEDYNKEALWKTMYILYDFRNLVRTEPKIWTEELRKSFMKGMANFVEVLSFLEGMDSESRKTGEHVVYERDWILAHNIQFSLLDAVYFLLKWVDSDDEILILTFMQTVEMLNQKVDGYRICRNEKTSIYHPLSRFLAGLYVCIRNRGMQLDGLVLNTLTTIYDDSILQPVLQIQVMIAQEAAGMWKRNGNPIVSRIGYYRDVDFRTEMIDRDIQLLQIGASITESDGFVVRLLKAFGLSEWFSSNFEEESNTKELICIAEQFLQLLIHVVSERYVPGVSYTSNEDRVKYEIIHWLCFKQCTYSEICDSIPLDLTTGVDEIINEITILGKSKKGRTYQLREEFTQRYNSLFYHYTPEQRSSADEIQRKRRKTAGKPDCFPPSVLPKLTESFTPIVNILQSKKLFHIIQVVLDRSINIQSNIYSFTLLENILYLIGHALQEEQTRHYVTLTFTQKAAKWKLLDRLEELLSSTRNYVPKDLLKWIIEKYYEVAGIPKNMRKELWGKDSEEMEKRRKLKLAAERRAQVMKEMAAKQNQFLENYNRQGTIKVCRDVDISQSASRNTYTCILCRESTQDLQHEVFVSPGYIQYSRVLCTDRKNITPNASPVLSSAIGPAFYTSSCGHVMHENCCRRHILENRPQFHLNMETEFLCPLCESLSNVVLPLLPPLSLIEKDNTKLSCILKYRVITFVEQFENVFVEKPFRTWESLAYTIHTIENLLRDAKKPILGHLSSRQHDCLERFVRLAGFASSTLVQLKRYNSLAWYVDYLNVLEGKNSNVDTLLRSDMFGLFVALRFSKCNELDFRTFRLIFVAHIVQILIITDFDGMVGDDKREEETPFKQVLELLGERVAHLSEGLVWTYIQEACFPFLRCCVLFTRFINDDTSPPKLTELEGNTFSNLCAYLGLSQTREELFHVKDIYPIVRNWFKHLEHHEDGGKEIRMVDPKQINQLIALPNEYRELIKMASSCKCPNTEGKAAADPYICLVCGEIFCSESCCSKIVRGIRCKPASLHYQKCGNELFLRVEAFQIVFPYKPGNRKYAIPAPYFNENYESYKAGSVDSPMFLCQEKYKELQTMWLSNDIFHEISRKTRAAVE